MASVPKNIGKIKIGEATCPICNTLFKGQYCPTCGLPISTTQKKRPELASYKEYQLCDSCDTANPFGAKYCKKCGKEMSLHAKDKNGHGWVDLGLSVLWSTEAINGIYLWNYNRTLFTYEDKREADFELLKKTGYKTGDIATARWGEKWRTPTKDEFEELFNLCKLEKCLDPISNMGVLKVVGPNGNSIIISKTEKLLGDALIEPFSENLLYFDYWTSTVCSDNDNRAYAFVFKNWILHLYGLCSSRVDKSSKIKDLEFKQSCFNRIFELITNTKKNKKTRSPLLDESKIVKCLEEIKNINIYSMKADVVLNQKMEELRCELFRLKKAEKLELWLETPMFDDIILRKKSKIFPSSIRPVVDKKWQGRL